ncbi:unannotated protein [freshwater metagenome]|uniref:Unannotated protein n=1 Tax=freshwater metagenome TaxID=449393 RepID=A0A6J6ECH7_9ZZZZ|nr:hypothetical protein [Actinomycetota bacterium]
MNIKSIGKYLVSVVVLTFGFFILFFASLPLFPKEVNEIVKQRVIGMKSSSPMEFANGKEFWWMVREGNTLTFHNSSDEIIMGTLVLELESNPCKSKERIIAEIIEDKNQYQLDLDELARFSIPFEIKGKSERILSLNFTNNKKCLLDNGDSRDFGAKLVAWSYL